MGNPRRTKDLSAPPTRRFFSANFLSAAFGGLRRSGGGGSRRSTRRTGAADCEQLLGPMATDDVLPLLNHRDQYVDGEHVEGQGQVAKQRDFSCSLLNILSLVCIFSLAISTVLFASLYFSVTRENPNKPPNWPPPSNSLLGEYSKAAVAADNELCSNIGRQILLKKGNAVDAAIATLFCIGVMDTQSSGLGGGHFMTIFNATTKKCHVVDAREVAPLAATENMYKDRWNRSKFGWEAIAVPGELSGMWAEYKNYGGKVPWKSLVQPTITLMEEGYPTSHALAFSLKTFEKQILKEPTMRKHFVNPETGKVYKVGEQITTRNNFVETLKQLAEAEDPTALFYRGNMTNSMVDEFRANGGLLTFQDFANYRAIVRPDSEVIYTHLANGRTICGPPPPSGSAVTQAILSVLDPIPFNNSSFSGNVDLLHRFIEASKFAYAARSFLGDMAFVANASEIAKNITSLGWAQMVRSKISWGTHPDSYYGGSFQALPEDHGTTHISVIDADGNAVSVTSTINLVFGATVMSESTGVLWNDQMDDFSSPGHPNYFGFPPSPSNFIVPGKKPMSSTSPLVIFRSNDQEMEVTSIGAAGGSTIISGVSGSAFRALWLGNSIKKAIDLPRLHNQLQPNITTVEAKMPQRYIEALKERGHKFKMEKTITVVTAVQMVGKGKVFANSDWRKGAESEPAGY